MIEKAAKSVTGRILSIGIISASDIPIYEYGFTLLFSYIVNVVWIMLIASLIVELPLALLYIIILATVRTQIGGYHAETYLGCFWCYICVFGFLLAMVRFLCMIRPGIVFTIVCFGFALLAEFFWAPVLRKKKLEVTGMKASKCKSIIRTTIWMILSIIMHFIYDVWSYQVVSVFVICVILMLYEKARQAGVLGNMSIG